MKTIWEQSYYGFEHLFDYWRDVHEAIDPAYNPKMKDIPAEFKGTIKVTITYEEQE